MKDAARGKSWNEKIQRTVDRAVETGEPHFEVHTDGHEHVSLLTVDVCGDNTLVYMTRAKTEQLIRRLQLAADAIPKRRRRKP